jgi:hypothetical protein
MAGSYRVWSPLPLSMITRPSDHRAMTSAILVIPPLVSIPLTAATLTLWVLVGRWADRLLRTTARHPLPRILQENVDERTIPSAGDPRNTSAADRNADLVPRW